MNCSNSNSGQFIKRLIDWLFGSVKFDGQQSYRLVIYNFTPGVSVLKRATPSTKHLKKAKVCYRLPVPPDILSWRKFSLPWGPTWRIVALRFDISRFPHFPSFFSLWLSFFANLPICLSVLCSYVHYYKYLCPSTGWLHSIDGGRLGWVQRHREITYGARRWPQRSVVLR